MAEVDLGQGVSEVHESFLRAEEAALADPDSIEKEDAAWSAWLAFKADGEQ